MQKFLLAATVGALVGLEANAWEMPKLPHLPTKTEAHQKIMENKQRHAHQQARKTKVDEHRFKEAHHNIQATRKRLGMAQVGMGGPQVRQNYAQLQSGAGFLLNMLSGMTYNEGSESRCYDAAESFIIAVDTGSDILRKIYIPAFWAEAQVTSQDFITLIAGVYVDCNLTQAFNTATELFTSEGISQLSGRVIGAWPFEISGCLKARNDPFIDQIEKGYKYGKCLSIVLNYTI